MLTSERHWITRRGSGPLVGLLFLIAQACGSATIKGGTGGSGAGTGGAMGHGGGGGTAGATGHGGAGGTAGGTGGLSPTGGQTGSGGTPATGGAAGGGGRTATGGTTGTGGTVSTGGTTATGGTHATGGTTGTGGTSSTGGTTGTGGVAGAGGAPVTCTSTQHLCGSTCADNTSLNNCGTRCNSACPTPANGTATCDGTKCGVACSNGYHDCGGTCASNSSLSSCGTLCTACPTDPHGTISCNSAQSLCQAACNTGYLECLSNPESCTPGSWSFEDGTVDGFQLLDRSDNAATGAPTVSTAHAADGTHALAVTASFDCTTRKTVGVVMYPCTEPIFANFQGKTFSFQVYVDTALPAYGSVQAIGSIADSNQSRGSAFDLQAGSWVSYSMLLNDPHDSVGSGMVFSLYMVPTGPPPTSACVPWTGTIYLDNFKIQ